MMRLPSRLIVLLLATALALSGCFQLPEDDEDDPEDGDADGGAPGSDGDGDGDGEGNGDGGDDGGGDNGGDGGDDGGNGGNNTDDGDKECHEYDPPQPAHPEDHEVDSVEDIRCTGQFMITDEGSGESWAVPAWSVDDWWRYEVNIAMTGYSECREIEQTVMGDDTTRFDLPVYSIENAQFDCDGEPSDKDDQEAELTKGHLMQISRDGYIQHNAIFPLAEGKGWTFMDQSGQLVEIEDVEYDDGGPLGSSEAWHLGWSREDESGSFEMEQTWSVAARNILEETITVTTTSGVFTITRTLVDSSYDFEDDGGVVT